MLFGVLVFSGNSEGGRVVWKNQGSIPKVLLGVLCVLWKVLECSGNFTGTPRDNALRVL